jgi:DNA-binding transcriptional MerR regulator
MFTVKEVSELQNIPISTLRYYTDKGLIPSIKRDNNNIRLFDSESVNWVISIKFLRKCGMTIEAIKEYVKLCEQGSATIPERYEMMKEQLRVAEADYEEAARRLEFLRNKVKKYSEIITGDLPDSINPKEW